MHLNTGYVVSPLEHGPVADESESPLLRPPYSYFLQLDVTTDRQDKKQANLPKRCYALKA